MKNVDCLVLSKSRIAQQAIEFTQQESIFSELRVLSNVTYISCIEGRRRLSGGTDKIINNKLI